MFRILQYSDRFFRSLLFSIIGIIFTIFYCGICMLAWPLHVNIRYRIITFWTRSMVQALRIICRINYQVEGLENIPKDRFGVVLSKHQSAWETFFIPNCFHSAAIIVKKELFWIPFFGWGLASMAPIAIDRSAQKTAMQQIIDKGKKNIAAGRWVIIFPEGTRIPPGKIGHYRLGGARLAVAADCPILPIAHNAGRYWPKNGFIKRPGTIKIVFGPLIETTGKKPEAVMEEAKQWIENTIQNIDKNF